MNIQTQYKQFIFEDDRPFPSCHASTLLVLGNGEVLVSWFGGTHEKANDVAIWLARRSADGRWSAPHKAADEADIPLWNPVLFRTKDGTILLYYKIGYEIPEWYTKVIASTDGGLTWTEPKELVAGDRGGRGPVKNKPVYLSNGVIAAPASLEGEHWDAFVDLSGDGGQTWTRSEIAPLNHARLAGKGVIQPTLWESGEGVHMLLRSSEGWVYRSDSTDGGHRWSEAYATDVPNNNSGIDATRLDNGNLALVCNPNGQDWGPRTPLVVLFSKDNGKSWGDELVLEHEEGEYSYPAIVSDGNDLHITYTWKRERIVYWKVTV